MTSHPTAFESHLPVQIYVPSLKENNFCWSGKRHFQRLSELGYVYGDTSKVPFPETGSVANVH